MVGKVRVLARGIDGRMFWPAVLLSGASALWLLTGTAGDAQEKIITTHAFTTFGDPPKYPADFPHLDYVNPDAPKGGEISQAAEGTFDSLNPYSTLDGTPGALSSIMYERILTSPDDDPLPSYCLLCETIEYPEDQAWVIFNLRKDVKFSDGTPFTAHDIVFSHNLLLEQGTPSYASYVGKVIPKVEALDDYRVKFTFATDVPKRDLISQAGGTPAWSKAWYEKTGARLDQSRLETSPGTGPYMLDSFDVGKRITYRRNPDYWGKDIPMMKGRSNFDTIRVEYFADSSAAMIGFTAGEYTFRRENSSINWATAYDFPAIQNGWAKREEPANGNVPAASGFVFNLRKEKFQDRRVRLAIGLMYNFTFTNKTVQYSLMGQRESFWQNTDMAATGVPEGAELDLLKSVSDKIAPEVLTEPALMPHTSGEQQLDRGNLRKALALMEEAGYTSGDDGKLRNAKGETLKVEFLETRQSFDRVVAPFIDNLERLGVDITYNRVDPAQYQKRTQEFDYDMIYDGHSMGLEEGIGLAQRFGSEDRNDVFNPAGFGNPAVDALILKVIDAKSHDEMATGVRAIDRIMRHEYFMVPAWYVPESWLAYYDMYDHVEPLPPYGTGELDYWWYNTEKADALKAAGAVK